MEFYFDRDQRPSLIQTPFVVSWMGRAAGGDLHAVDYDQRVAAWAAWAVSALVGVEGSRSYAALALPGRFYDPKGGAEAPRARPHMEISAGLLSTPAPEFPDRLALAGNALEFPWWMYSEVVAVKRGILSDAGTDITPLIELLSGRGGALRHGLTLMRDAAKGSWNDVERLLVTSADGLVGVACGDFSRSDVASYIPEAAPLGLHVTYEARLRERNGAWAARRVGVWQVKGRGPDGPFSVGVVTPRLTRNSTFADSLFDPASEGLGAVLVRTLVLRRLGHLLGIDRRILAYHVGGADPKPVRPTKVAGSIRPHLRGVPVRPGDKIPEASFEAAIGFVQAFPHAEDAWAALNRWSGPSHLLTVSKATFLTAYRRTQLRISRAEEPDRDDVNLLLPLAWDERGHSLRVTFSRGSDT